MNGLKNKHCVPCEGGVKPLSKEEIMVYSKGISAEWKVVDNERIKREFTLKSFMKSISFIQQIAEIADSEDHHPDMHVYYKDVVIELSTHAIGGLSDNDFIMAAKIDDISI